MISSKPQYIYTLSDPITGYVRYVGKTNSPENREKQHLLHSNGYKKEWIDKLVLNGLKPVFEVIEKVEGDIKDGDYLEKYYMSLFVTWGFDLFNCTGIQGAVQRKIAPPENAEANKLDQAKVRLILKDKFGLKTLADIAKATGYSLQTIRKILRPSSPTPRWLRIIVEQHNAKNQKQDEKRD